MSFDFIVNSKYKIDDYINKNFKCIYEYNFKSEIYLLSGAIFDIIKDKKPKDMDFVVISKDDKEIYEFIKHNNFNYLKNSFGGYKINDNSTIVDIWNVESLEECFQYNVDGLVYNIKDKQIISLGFSDALRVGKVELINTSKVHPNPSRELERYNKVVKILNEYA